MLQAVGLRVVPPSVCVRASSWMSSDAPSTADSVRQGAKAVVCSNPLVMLMPVCMCCSGKCGYTLALDKKPEEKGKGKKGKKEKA